MAERIGGSGCLGPGGPFIGSASARFLASSATSLLGNSVAGVALPLALLVTTGDAYAAGALALICMVPQALAGIVGGAALSVLNRRDMSAISDFVSAASMAMLPIVDATVGLSFGWFVALGLLGAIGDVPGMTARDALIPSVCEKDGIDMRRYIGLSQAAENLAAIIGPSIAAVCVGLIGAAGAFAVTATTSAVAACITLTIPREVGKAPSRAKKDSGAMRFAADSARRGVRSLLFKNPLLRLCVILPLLSMAVLGGYEGLILPAHFVEEEQVGLLGFVLSAMSAGMLAGSALFSMFSHRLSDRQWYVASLLGMSVGIAALSPLPSFPILSLGAAVLGMFCGPFSAVLGYRMIREVNDEERAAALGIQNTLMLVASPVAVFAASLLTGSLGPAKASVALALAWMLLVAYALNADPAKRL